VIGEVRLQTQGSGIPEQGSLISIFVGLSICLLCVSLIAVTQNRKSKAGLSGGLLMKEARAREKRRQGRRQGTIVHPRVAEGQLQVFLQSPQS